MSLERSDLSLVVELASHGAPLAFRCDLAGEPIGFARRGAGESRDRGDDQIACEQNDG